MGRMAFGMPETNLSSDVVAENRGNLTFWHVACQKLRRCGSSFIRNANANHQGTIEHGRRRYCRSPDRPGRELQEQGIRGAERSHPEDGHLRDARACDA